MKSRLHVLFVLLLLSCGGMHRKIYDGSLIIGVEQNRLQYRPGDTLVIDLEIANDGVRDEYVSQYPYSFQLMSLYREDLSHWSPFDPEIWFASGGQTADHGTVLTALKPEQTKTLSVPFVFLHDEMPYDSLHLLLLYRVTVELDSLAVKYSVFSRDTIVVLKAE